MQKPDTQPGPYWITVFDSERGKIARLSGPYNTHAEALIDVNPLRQMVYDFDARAHWYHFGTCRDAGVMNNPNFKPVGFLQTKGLYKIPAMTESRLHECLAYIYESATP